MWLGVVSVSAAMCPEVVWALAITDASGPAERTVDVTTIGRRSGQPRRIETWFYRHGEAIYLSGRPAPRPRQWLMNLQADPRMTFHLKGTVVADLAATAAVLSDPVERRPVLEAFHPAFLLRNAHTGVSARGSVEDWIEHCPLVRVDFDAVSLSAGAQRR